MEKFIRLDTKGEWRGTEHVSSVQGMGEEFGLWEKGISCYNLKDQDEALASLRDYWFDIASITEEDLENMQITIFEGEQLENEQGGDFEDLAICTRTIKEIDAKDIMIKINELHEDMLCGNIDEWNYLEKLNEIEL